MKQVLDHGYVRLVDHMGSDLSIVRSARVSYNADWREHGEKNDHKLIKFLWDNHHTTPFESVEFQFEVKAPLFVLRQWHRHRTWTFNEVSGRYTELPDEFYVPELNMIGAQSTDNKQGREFTEADRSDDLGEYESVCQDVFDTYRRFIGNGWPRELARMVLPLSTYSRMFAKVDLLNLLKFIRLRDHSHAQHEIQVYAKAMLDLIRPIVPVAIQSYEETTWVK